MGRQNGVMIPINYFDKVDLILLVSLRRGVKHVLTLNARTEQFLPKR
jgi:hypothetical protein